MAAPLRAVKPLTHKDPCQPAFPSVLIHSRLRRCQARHARWREEYGWRAPQYLARPRVKLERSCFVCTTCLPASSSSAGPTERRRATCSHLLQGAHPLLSRMQVPVLSLQSYGSACVPLKEEDVATAPGIRREQSPPGWRRLESTTAPASQSNALLRATTDRPRQQPFSDG